MPNSRQMPAFPIKRSFDPVHQKCIPPESNVSSNLHKTLSNITHHIASISGRMHPVTEGDAVQGGVAVLESFRFLPCSFYGKPYGFLGIRNETRLFRMTKRAHEKHMRTYIQPVAFPLGCMRTYGRPATVPLMVNRK